MLEIDDRFTELPLSSYVSARVLFQFILMPGLPWMIHGSDKWIAGMGLKEVFRDASTTDARFSVGVIAWLGRACTTTMTAVFIAFRTCISLNALLVPCTCPSTTYCHTWRGPAGDLAELKGKRGSTTEPMVYMIL